MAVTTNPPPARGFVPGERPRPPQRAPISGARLAAPFVEARRSDRREPGWFPWMRPLVVLSGLSGSCVGRLNNARSSGRVRKRSSSLSSAALSGRWSASLSTAASASILPPGVGLAFLLPLAPLFFAYAGLWRRFLGEQLFEFFRCHCCLPAGYHATRAASPPLRSKALTTY